MPNGDIEMIRVFTTRVADRLGQCRIAPVVIDGRRFILAIHAETPNVDPYNEIFRYPVDSPELVLLDLAGNTIWRRRMGAMTVPGIWFAPVLPFDLDGDGSDEVWYVENTGELPFSNKSLQLTRLDPATGTPTGSWPWTNQIARWRRPSRLSLTFMFRFFLMGGYVHGKPVLLFAKGTYQDMLIEAFDAELNPRWSHGIRENDPGARGSHVTPIVDLNGDGIDELLWGERCIELATGRELFCCDRDSYGGHSDLIQPVVNHETKEITICTARETEEDTSPRVNAYTNEGERIWGALDSGHMHANYVVRLKDYANPLVVAVETGGEGQVLVADVATGERVSLPLDVELARPVDVDGDGYHELLFPDGLLLAGDGTTLGSVEGNAAFRGNLTPEWPGEQIVTTTPEGTVSLWRDAHAKPSVRSAQRENSSFYRSALRHHAVGYNWNISAGA